MKIALAFDKLKPNILWKIFIQPVTSNQMFFDWNLIKFKEQ